ncbi:MAG: pseudomurein-binding repeat-containing protein, partial [Methanobacteriaceae archaeon]
MNILLALIISIVLLSSASVYAEEINSSDLNLFTNPSENLKINEANYNSVNTKNIDNTGNADNSIESGSVTNKASYLLESDGTPQNSTITNTSNKTYSPSNNSPSSIVDSSANKSNQINNKNVENTISNIKTGGILAAAGDTALSSLSKSDILSAAASLEAYVAKYGTVPNYITIAKQNFSMSEFLYLLSKAVVNVNSGINSNITIKYIKDPVKPSGTSISGNLYKNDYVDLAKRVSTFIEKNGISPNYGSSKIGSIQFQTLILGFSKVLEFTKINNRLPNYISLNVKSTSKLNTVIPKYNSSSQFTTSDNSNNGNTPNTNTSTGTNTGNNNTGTNTGSSTTVTGKTVTINDILDASARFKSYVETNKKIPTTISVAGTNYSLGQF